MFLVQMLKAKTKCQRLLRSFQLEAEQFRAGARRLTFTNPWAQGLTSCISKKLEVCSNSKIQVFISEKLGLESGPRLIFTSSGSSRYDTKSSTSAQEKIGLLYLKVLLK